MNITKDMVTEVHQSVVHQVATLSFCLTCGLRYFISFLTFEQTKGRCSCSWSCCDTARPGNRAHARHLGVRPATDQDISDAQAGTIKDFRTWP